MRALQAVKVLLVVGLLGGHAFLEGVVSIGVGQVSLAAPFAGQDIWGILRKTKSMEDDQGFLGFEEPGTRSYG